MNKIKDIYAKLDEGRQYRNVLVKNFETRKEEDGKMFVRGYAATFNEPYILYKWDNYTVIEQVDPAAFDECDMSDVIMQYDHVGRVFARISNDTLSLSKDYHGLGIEARLDGTQIGRQLFEEIEGGYTTKMSIGFIVKEDKREITENHDDGSVTVLRTITKIEKLFDVSAVSLPANDATEISARSYGEGVIAEIKKELLDRRERQKQKIKILMEATK